MASLWLDDLVNWPIENYEIFLLLTTLTLAARSLVLGWILRHASPAPILLL